MARRFLKTERIVEREIRGEHILVPVMGDMAALDSLYTLNPLAGAIFRHAGDGLSEDEIVARIVAEHDVDDSVARADAERTLDELVAIGALCVED